MAAKLTQVSAHSSVNSRHAHVTSRGASTAQSLLRPTMDSLLRFDHVTLPQSEGRIANEIKLAAVDILVPTVVE